MTPSGSMAALKELILLRVRSFLREPEALFWTFGFPILMAIGLGLAFRDRPAEPSLVGVERGSVAERYEEALRAEPDLRVTVLGAEEAAQKLRRGEVALVLAGTDSLVFRYDPARPESQVARLMADRAVQAAGGATRPVAVAEDRARQPGSRYIDWVIPGLIGLNLMSTGMWGIGFGMVTMRQKKQLKRLAATPMKRSDFLVSQIVARLGFLILEVPPIVLFAWLAFGVEVRGSLLDLVLVVLLGTAAFGGLGLLASSRARTIEGVSGIINVVMLPMFILSGVFFSSKRFPDVLQPFIQALPLTALNDAMRAVYNDGLSLAAVPIPMAILAVWTIGSVFLALRLFRWQ
jgi:ABC transporter DrrB family efflux protein